MASRTERSSICDQSTKWLPPYETAGSLCRLAAVWCSGKFRDQSSTSGGFIYTQTVLRALFRTNDVMTCASGLGGNCEKNVTAFFGASSKEIELHRHPNWFDIGSRPSWQNVALLLQSRSLWSTTALHQVPVATRLPLRHRSATRTGPAWTETLGMMADSIWHIGSAFDNTILAFFPVNTCILIPTLPY